MVFLLSTFDGFVMSRRDDATLVADDSSCIVLAPRRTALDRSAAVSVSVPLRLSLVD